MTVRINFLPRNYQPPKQMGAREWGMIAAAAAAVAMTGAFYANAYAGTVRMEQETEVNQAQHQQVKALLAEAEAMRVREERVAQAERDLKALSGRHWSGVLLTLRELTPQQVTWTSLNVTGNDIELKGTSRGLLDVAQLFGGLIDHREVAEVALRYVNEQGIPVTIALKQGDTSKLAEGIGPVGVFRQLEFEMVITLVPAEGRQLPHGD